MTDRDLCSGCGEPRPCPSDVRRSAFHPHGVDGGLGRPDAHDAVADDEGVEDDVPVEDAARLAAEGVARLVLDREDLRHEVVGLKAELAAVRQHAESDAAAIDAILEALLGVCGATAPMNVVERVRHLVEIRTAAVKLARLVVAPAAIPGSMDATRAAQTEARGTELARAREFLDLAGEP